MSDLDRNKRNVVAFYDLAFNQCAYIQHNPGVADG